MKRAECANREKKVLRRDRKQDKEILVSFKSFCKQFRVVGPATANARPPYMDKLILG